MSVSTVCAAPPIDANEDVAVSASVKSVSNAFKILDVVAQHHGPISLKEIGRRAGVSPSKAHRYLQSLCGCGLLSQAFKSGSYDLGVTAMRLGLSAVNRVDVVNRAGDALPALVEALDADAFVTVWSELGPTVVRCERSRRPAAALVGPGVTFPVLTSATGLVFLSFAGGALVEDVLRRETQYERNISEHTQLTVRAEISAIREAGYASVAGALLPGRYCVAAPIISIDDHIIAAVTLVSTNPNLADPEYGAVERLVSFCRRHSIPKRGYAEETLIEQKIAV